MGALTIKEEEIQRIMKTRAIHIKDGKLVKD
jgi:hypothetical protein